MHIFSRLAFAVCLAATVFVARDSATAVEPASPASAAVSSPWPPGRTFDNYRDSEKRIFDILAKPAEFQLIETTLEDIARFINEKHQLPIAFDQNALAADGKEVTLQITLDWREGSLANALFHMLEPHGLTYVVTHERLLVTTKAAASQPENLITRLYQVHDLVIMPNDPTASRPNFDTLMTVLEGTVRPSDWENNGGTIGSVQPFAGPGLLALIIKHDEPGHREIERLFNLMRSAKVPQLLDGQKQQPLPPPPSVGTAAASGSATGSVPLNQARGSGPF